MTNERMQFFRDNAEFYRAVAARIMRQREPITPSQQELLDEIAVALVRYLGGAQ